MIVKRRKTIGEVKVEHRSLPTRERMAKAGTDFEIGGDDRAGKVIRIMDAPLDRMRSREMIGAKEYAAQGLGFVLSWCTRWKSLKRRR